MEKKLPVTLAHRKWECVYVVLDKREIKHADKKSMKIREKESLRRQIEKEKRSYQSPWHIGNGTVCMWFWIKEKLKRIKLRDKESLRRQIDKKIRWKGKEVTSHPGTQEMGVWNMLFWIKEKIKRKKLRDKESFKMANR